MDKAYFTGVETLSLYALVRLSVDFVAEDGVSDICEMNTYLVSSSRFEPEPHICIAAELPEHAVMRHGIAAVFSCYAHFLAVGLVPADRSVDSALGLLEAPAGYRLVLACEAVSLYLLREVQVRCVILRNDEQSAGILVDAVDYPGTDNAVYAGKAVAAVVEQSINKSPVVVAVCRVDYHALWLVDNEQVIVLVDYIEGDILRDSVHRVCPDIILWGLGGEARWCGTESGYTNETTWSMGSGLSGNENEWKWFPSESDAKATSHGWFWHDGESTKDSETLFKMYLETVGRNATLILNFPPDKSGRLTNNDSIQLCQLGDKLRKRFGTDLARTATVTTSETRSGGYYDAYKLIDDDKNTYWATEDGQKTATITLTWNTPQTVRYVTLQEFIRKGQRIKGFTIETTEDGSTWTRRASNIQTTTVGYKRIIPLNGNTGNSYGSGYKVRGVRVKITDSRACPLLHTLSVF